MFFSRVRLQSIDSELCLFDGLDPGPVPNPQVAYFILTRNKEVSAKLVSICPWHAMHHDDVASSTTSQASTICTSPTQRKCCRILRDFWFGNIPLYSGTSASPWLIAADFPSCREWIVYLYLHCPKAFIPGSPQSWRLFALFFQLNDCEQTAMPSLTSY